LRVYKRYIGPSGGGGSANSVHDCQRRAFDQRVFVTSRRDTGSLLPSSYVGGRAGGMSWCRQLTGWLSTSGLPVIISLSVSHLQSRQRNVKYINWVDGVIGVTTRRAQPTRWLPQQSLNHCTCWCRLASLTWQPTCTGVCPGLF